MLWAWFKMLLPSSLVSVFESIFYFASKKKKKKKKEMIYDVYLTLCSNEWVDIIIMVVWDISRPRINTDM